MAVDSVGNLYCGDYSGNVYLETPQSDGSYAQSTIVNGAAAGSYAIAGNLATGPSGDLFFFETTGTGEYGFTTYGVAEDSLSQPPTLSFAATAQGSTSSDSPRVVTVSNLGNASLQFSSVTFPADFPESSDTTGDCTSTTTLAVGASCTLSIDFRPTATPSGISTPLNENVEITTNTLNAPATVQAITVTGTETSKPTPLTVRLNSAQRNYGAANPTFTATVSGLLNGNTVTVTPQTTATQSSPVGSYPITATVTGANAANYTITVVPSTLVVTKAPLYISASNVAVTYGQMPAQPTAYSLTGFVNGDTASVVSGSPVLSTTVTSTTPVGFYKIGVAVGTLTAANYFFDTTSSGEGAVGVYKAPLKVTVNNLTMTQGSAVPALTYTITGFVNGDTAASAITGTPVLSTTATSSSAPGDYPITLNMGSMASQNYAIPTGALGILIVQP